MNLSNFPERLKELLFYANLNYEKVSAKLGISKATLSRYLNGVGLPAVEICVQLADFFNCSCDYLLGVIDEDKHNNFSECPPFGERLQFLCRKFGYSKYRLRKEAEISETAMRYWSRGKTAPSIINVAKIAEVFNVSIDYVLGRSDEY